MSDHVTQRLEDEQWDASLDEALTRAERDGDDIAPGVYDWDDEEYFEFNPPGGVLSASALKTLARPGGAAEYRWMQDHPQPPKDAFDVGHAAHTMVLGRGPRYVAVAGSRSTKAVKEKIAQVRADGLVPLRPEEYDDLHFMATSLADSPWARELLTAPGESEMTYLNTMRVRDGEVWVRSRLDRVSWEHGVVDYKTGHPGTADPEKFAGRAFDLGYDIQQAVYLRQVAELAPQIPAEFTFVCQEAKPPYRVSVIQLPDDLVDAGWRRAMAAADLWAECRGRGRWPGYPNSTVTAPMPRWVEAQIERVS